MTKVTDQPNALPRGSSCVPGSLRQRVQHLNWRLQESSRRLVANNQAATELESYLRIAPDVSVALQQLSTELFEQDLILLREKLSIALSEVLKQPIQFVANAEFKGGLATVEFAIERDGHVEDIRRGQGGSVHNVLSVGLRMFALTMLDADRHRRFLMLDEQDCWLRPDLIPDLVRIVHQAGKLLGYQVIMISHHDLGLFDRYADRIYRFEPVLNSVNVSLVQGTADGLPDSSS